MKLEDFSKYKSHKPTMKPNKLDIPVNNISFSEEGMVEFNEIYQYCLEQEKLGNLHQMVMTKSQGICIKYGVLRGACWHLKVGKAFIELLIRNLNARYYRFIVGYQKDKKTGPSGRRAFQLYTSELSKSGVNINDLAIDNGEEVKATIPSPKIDCVVSYERVFKNAHHLDINSAFNAGMIEAFPVLEPAVRRMYNLRKEKPYYKDVLNMTQGFMQSELVSYRFSHISKAGYVYTNKKIEELSKKLEESGRRILSYNTDGIWYQGEIYHDSDEGTDIGQWKNDHINCMIRFKSKGCYEFIDGEGNYKPVFRGESSYEKLVPREQWKWGDIFKGDVINYKFIEGVGLVNYVDY